MDPILDNIFIWRMFRSALDLGWGLYRKSFAIFQEFGITPEMSIVDVGCGTGYYAELTRARYVGLDFNERYLAEARRVHGSSNREFLNRDITELRLTGQRFDVGLMVGVVHHLDNAGAAAVLRALAAVVSRGVALCEPVQPRPANLPARLLAALDRGRFTRPRAELIALIEQYFDIESVREFRAIAEMVCIFARSRR
ncbi:class I SAM-dependent methyltransferase [Candidatus Parcubacteria bacterium]|nr:class I SAM-dependent methyltransferase [Candidatus Parcubacteria bacterium]